MSTHEQSETVQLLYKLNIRSLEDEDEDYDGDIYYDPETQAPIFADLMAAFTHSYQAVDAPYYELPKGVEGSNYFMSFDKELGAVLCVNYRIQHKILYDTEKFIAALKAIDDDIGRGFDSWIDCHFEFKSCGKQLSVSASWGPDRIVAPVACTTQFLFRWNNIDEIEKVDWAIGYENDALNIVRPSGRHEEEVARVNRRIEDITELLKQRGEDVDGNISIQHDKELLEMFKWVEAHKDRYFYGTYC